MSTPLRNLQLGCVRTCDSINHTLNLLIDAIRYLGPLNHHSANESELL